MRTSLFVDYNNSVVISVVSKMRFTTSVKKDIAVFTVVKPLWLAERRHGFVCVKFSVK